MSITFKQSSKSFQTVFLPKTADQGPYGHEGRLGGRLPANKISYAYS